MKLRSVLAGLIVMALGVTVVAAKETFTEGSTWTGILRTAHVNNKTKKTSSNFSYDIKLVIKTVKDDQFTGEFYKENDRHGLEIEGKITPKGVISFYPTKEIKGKGGWPDNTIGNWTFAANLKGKQIIGRATRPGTGQNYTYLSEYTIKLKE